MIGEDADFEKRGRVLNRVIKWERDGITIEEVHRHVRERFHDLSLEQANPVMTPLCCGKER